MAGTSADRLVRLLGLVGYLRDRSGIHVDDLARHFGVTREQVLADVNLLWVTGRPGYLHDDLVDFSPDAIDEGVVELVDAQDLDRPVRLSPAEAVALLVAVRGLGEVLTADGTAGAPAQTLAVLASAREKLTAAAGAAAETAETVTLTAPAAAPAAVATVRGALDEGRRLRLRYVSTRDEVSERDVEPAVLRWDAGSWSLDAWCHRARGPRTFRLDRVLALDVLPEPVDADRVAQVAAEAGASGGWGQGDGAREVVLDLAPQAQWLVERTPVEEVTELPDGTVRVRLAVGDPAWFTGLLLSLGGHVRRVDPPAAGREAAARARAALAAYGELDRELHGER